ncbi:MAG: serine hydrolase [Tumebacillaceae bacterium]
MLHQLQDQLRALLDAAEGTYGVAIYHFESKQEFLYQPEERFYAASIIKVPIMAAVYEQASQGTLSLSEKIVVRAEDMVGGSGVLGSLSPNLELSIYDLVVLMIIESDNTATNVLIDRLGSTTIQQSMREWGLTNSQFYNKLQVIPAKIEGYNEICAGDMNHLLKQIGQGKIVSWRACAEMVKIMKQQLFNDGIPSLLPPERDEPIGAIPEWQMAHKTGFINGIEHDMGLLYLAGATFAVTVLSKEITDRAEAKCVQGQIGRMLFDAIK